MSGGNRLSTLLLVIVVLSKYFRLQDSLWGIELKQSTVLSLYCGINMLCGVLLS